MNNKDDNIFKALNRLCPEVGDCVTIMNCGTHFELQHQHFNRVPFFLTEDDIAKLNQGLVTWN